MKKFLSYKKTAIIFLAIAVLLLGVYVYMLARPISYGMKYHNETVYEGQKFVSDIKFNSDKTMTVTNAAYEDGQDFRYYYKNGYIFNLMAQTDEEYEIEVEAINKDFESAVNTPFYASKINAFKLTNKSDDGSSIGYTCKPAIVIAVVGGVLEVALIGFGLASLIVCIKSKKNKEI